MQADKAALDELGDDERLVLTRVARRMWEAVGDDYVHDVTNVVANIDEAAEAVHRGDAARRDGARQPLGGGQGTQGRPG